MSAPASRDVKPGESWAFDEHRTVAETDILRDIAGSIVTSARRISFADAMTAAIRTGTAFEIDGLRFERRRDIPEEVDHVYSGRHTLVYELAGSGGKTYRLSVEPVPETHR